jgi:hypothetical protein
LCLIYGRSRWALGRLCEYHQKGTWLQVTTSERKRHSRLSLIGWRHRQHCAGVFAFVLVSSPMLRWCLPNCNAVTRHCHRAGFLAGAALASSRAPRWHHCWHLLASPSASRWHLHPCCAGIIPLGAPVSVQSPLMTRCCTLRHRQVRSSTAKAMSFALLALSSRWLSSSLSMSLSSSSSLGGPVGSLFF